MSLVTCGECGKQVSSLAQACPGCGAPIVGAAAAKAVGQAAVTTELTSKALKKQVLVAWLLVIFGLFMAFGEQPGMKAVGFAMVIFGAIVGITARARAWWHHG